MYPSFLSMYKIFPRNIHRFPVGNNTVDVHQEGKIGKIKVSPSGADLQCLCDSSGDNKRFQSYSLKFFQRFVNGESLSQQDSCLSGASAYFLRRSDPTDLDVAKDYTPSVHLPIHSYEKESGTGSSGKV